MIIDLFTFIIGGWGAYQGFTRGIIRTILTVFSILFGLVVAFKLTPAATRFLETAFDSENPFLFLGGFLMVFVLTMIIIRITSRFLEGALQAAKINILNQFLGALLLSSLYLLLFSYVIQFAEASRIITDKTRQESVTLPLLKALPSKMKSVYEFVKPAFKDFWNESIRFLEKMEEQAPTQTESKPTIFDVPEEEPSSQ